MSDSFNINDVVAFVVEIVALVLIGTWAWRTVSQPTWLRIVAVCVLIGAAITLWALFASPQATFQVLPLAIAVKALVLGGSVLAAVALSPSPPLPTAWGAVVVVNTTLIYVGPFAR